MSLLPIVPNASEIQNRSKEIRMAIEDYLRETQSICNKSYEVPKHGEYDLNNAMKLLSGTSDYRSSWRGEDFSETNGCKKSKMLDCNWLTVVLSSIFSHK